MMYKNSLNNPKYSKLINEIIRLNKAVSEDSSLGDGFRIGHSYFCCGTDAATDERLRNILEYEILPLLKEYWFDEPDKFEDWSGRLTAALN